LSVAQLIALVVGGIWAAFLFVKFDARDKEIGRAKAELELERLKAAPIKFDQEISIGPYRPNGLGRKDLGVDYRYVITNTSNQKIKIALVVVNTLLLPPQSLGDQELLEIPRVSVEKDSPWRRLISKAYLAEGEMVEDGVVRSKQGFTVKPLLDAGIVGELEAGESTWGTLSVIAGNKNADYIGFTVDAYVRFADDTTRWITADQYARLAPGQFSGAPQADAPREKAPPAK
jgi:hypothetical protein